MNTASAGKNSGSDGADVTAGRKGTPAARRLLRAAWSGFADLLFPAVCAGCGRAAADAGGLCGACEIELLDLIARPYCIRCGAGTGPGIPVGEEGCSRCPSPLPRFRRIVRLGSYAPPLSTILTGLKYRGDTGMADRLGSMLAGALAAVPAVFDVIVPVPMHVFGRMTRPVDHARILARAVAKRAGIPLSAELVRVRNTLRQTGMSRTRRRENLAGAFRPRNARALAGARVLLVDDVVTTTATTGESARALLAAGAASVTVAAVARTEEQGGG